MHTLISKALTNIKKSDLHASQKNCKVMTTMLFFSKVVNHKTAITFEVHTICKILNREIYARWVKTPSKWKRIFFRKYRAKRFQILNIIFQWYFGGQKSLEKITFLIHNKQMTIIELTLSVWLPTSNLFLFYPRDQGKHQSQCHLTPEVLN